MAGSSLKELKISLIIFIDLIEKMNLGERIAIITFGGTVNLLSGLTQDYHLLKLKIAKLTATGGTPMTEALVATLACLKYSRPLQVGPITLMPRIILFTDGAPNDPSSVKEVAKTMGIGIPMVCIGVAACDKKLMGELAKLSGGMFLMANDISYLQIFFLRQVLLILFILEVQEQIEQIYNREVLREYLESKSGHPVSDTELDGFLYFLQHLIRITPSNTKSSNTRLLTYKDTEEVSGVEQLWKKGSAGLKAIVTRYMCIKGTRLKYAKTLPQLSSTWSKSIELKGAAIYADKISNGRYWIRIQGNQDRFIACGSNESRDIWINALVTAGSL
jgi:uncharacterized protein YegL/mRNA-degrading endonuclease HigB of HigAB toxin-antitoxin module